MAAGVAVASGAGARAVDLELGGLSVRLWQAVDLAAAVDVEALLGADDPPEPPYWMHLWPGAMALARLLAAAPGVGPGSRVVELGCGLALPALVAARRGATVVATDREAAALAFAVRSAASNRCSLHCLRMDWGAPALRGGFDLCLGADVGYDRGAEAVLVEALAALAAPGGRVWLADSVNTARSGLAAALEREGFAVAVRQTREWEEGRPVWVRLIEARR